MSGESSSMHIYQEITLEIKATDLSDNYLL